MRQIKFRALAVVNDKHNGIKVGDFVYGSYIESGVDAPCIIFGDGEQIEVDRKTLGQFIVKNNGVEFYEGDVVSQEKNCMYQDGRHNKEVAFIGDQFCSGGYSVLSAIEHFGANVIGNIHQNPELLEQ